MDIPYNGKVNIRLIVKRYKNTILYDVYEKNRGEFICKPCKLSTVSMLTFPFVRFFNDSMEIDNCSTGAYWERLFFKFEDAKKEEKRLNGLYADFKKHPFLRVEMLEEHKQDLLNIEKQIEEGLKDYPNFEGIDFCDVSANGIQIRGHHKDIKNYSYGDQPTIKYDFSNKNTIARKFINMWKIADTPGKIRKELEFIREGEEYGWE